MRRLEQLSLWFWIFFSLWQIGFDSPDEHFQTLEASSFLLFGRWSQTWEWESGLRSFFSPLLISGLLKPWIVLGITDRIWLDRLGRLLLALLQWIGIRYSLRFFKKPNSSSHFDLLLVAWPLMVWGTRWGPDTLCIALFLIALGSLLQSVERPWRSGVFAALAFTVRYTVGVPLFIAWVIFGIQNRKLAWKSAGVSLLVVGALSGLDAYCYSYFLGHAEWPAFEFFKFNIVRGSAQFHPSPWYELLFYLLLLWIPFGGWMRFRLKPLSSVGWVLVGSIFVFSLLRHQELRFILPLLPLTLLAFPPQEPKWIRFGLASNFIFMVLAGILYSAPHGALVQGLNFVSANAKEGSQLFLVDSAGDGALPLFYLQKNLQVRRTEESELNGIQVSGFWALTRNPITTLGCTLIRELDPGIGYRLRQRISETKAPRFAYHCQK